MSTRDSTVPAWMENQSLSAPVVVKSETSEKPRFIPKVPVKKEKSDAPVIEKPTAADKPPSNKGNGDKFKNKGRGDKNDGRGNGRNNFKPNNQGRGAGGRGQWVMPTGTAFFTGNAAAVPTVSSNNGGTLIGNPHLTQRIMRPNEAEILGLAGSRHPKSEDGVKSDIKDTSSDNSLAHYYAQQRANEDSDSDDVPDEQDAVDKNGCEIWPPTLYDALAPLSLPLGPKTANMRVMLAAESILADPSDAEALDKEESSSLFLMQMPSDLNFDKILESRRQDGEEGTTSSDNSEGVRVKDGRLGKLQLLKSGKVRLLTESGKSYEVSSGMAASFAQYLTAIQLNEVAPETRSAETATGASSSGAKPAAAKGGKKGDSSSAKTQEHVLDPRRTGSVHFMGNITKKLVITPDYEIGTKRNKNSESRAQRNIQYQQQIEEEGVDEEEDIEDMYNE